MRGFLDQANGTVVTGSIVREGRCAAGRQWLPEPAQRGTLSANEPSLASSRSHESFLDQLCCRERTISRGVLAFYFMAVT
jgi:hypothetical protein